jgi:hypothetical protein
VSRLARRSGTPHEPCGSLPPRPFAIRPRPADCPIRARVSRTIPARSRSKASPSCRATDQHRTSVTATRKESVRHGWHSSIAAAAGQNTLYGRGPGQSHSRARRGVPGRGPRGGGTRPRPGGTGAGACPRAAGWRSTDTRAPRGRAHGTRASRPRGAEEHYLEALAGATRLCLRPLAACCHLGLGRLHRRRGESGQARDHLDTALGVLREMGMTLWAEQAERERAALVGG